MTRLIDETEAYIVLTKVYHHKTETQHESLREALSKVTTADAEPVRHGKWIVTNEGVVKCSECKRKFILLKENYCPHCGARMDEERREE